MLEQPDIPVKIFYKDHGPLVIASLAWQSLCLRKIIMRLLHHFAPRNEDTSKA